ncbi:N-acetylglucosaminyl deacetylase, LmbE family [Sphingomonas palmae]|uniref:N-acetylglucosaminyl deacetylase, LmbE family n=1 Tax=Sphingomonas palmae TaxID=1855283 RepID=A0A1H7HAH0_9SPHN|nr:PIG-L family deacetylase [Sphingomonas palmae]SEK45095.1 N-acetylglucosaminyl deacetylase, LmbE family [Sphingomonas palmae]
MVVTPGQAHWRRTVLRARRLPIAQAARDGWLILAPHPDDEALGAGGLIAGLSSAGARLRVAFLTDGAASHVGAPGWSARRVAALRAGEARAALRVLGASAPPVWCGWRDAAPFAVEDPRFARTVDRLVAMCRRHGLTRIATTWSADPHCDHQAAAAVARAVARRLGIVPLFYCVWGWTRGDIAEQLATVRPIVILSQGRRGVERRALACHRSQLGGRITGARDRFVLPRAMRRLADRRLTLLLVERDAA